MKFLDELSYHCSCSYVNKKGKVIERFLGIKHVKETTSEALKIAVVQVLSAHGLTIAQLRGQGYDGASNMRGEFNGVQKLIRDENPYIVLLTNCSSLWFRSPDVVHPWKIFLTMST